MVQSLSRSSRNWLLRMLLLLLFLYLFLISITLLGGSLKFLGKDFAEKLIQTTANPFIGLFIGILTTSIIQSSSATTSIVVGMVASGTLTVPGAIPIVMGANIGTTITNAIVSLAHVNRPIEFRRAYAGATIHDVFNLLCVLVFLPLELLTHYMEKTAFFLAKIFSNIGGFTVTSPLKLAVKPVAEFLQNYLLELFSHDFTAGIVGIVIALILLFLSLTRIVKLMKRIVIGKFEVLIHSYLFANPMRSLTIGLIFTAIIQSSSVSTSLIVPLVGAGFLTVEQVLPYTLGANIGTTVTAILAALVTQNPYAITTAFIHLLFNISGAILWYPFKPLRSLPLGIAKWLGKMVFNKRWLGFVFIAVIFFIIPIILIYLS